MVKNLSKPKLSFDFLKQHKKVSVTKSIEQRPAFFNITQIKPDGELTINFSEEFKNYEELRSGRILKEEFLEIVYFNNMDGCSTLKPSLKDWYILDNGFTNS